MPTGHYIRIKGVNYNPQPITPLSVRFYKHLKTVESGCIEFIGCRDKYGYGFINSGEFRPNGKKIIERAYRVAWRLANGPIPKGMMVCHRCDNPPCCNLDHLFLGPALVNSRDAVQKWRCSHKLTKEQVKEVLGSAETNLELSKKFGVHRSTIERVRKGRSWKHMNERQRIKGVDSVAFEYRMI